MNIDNMLELEQTVNNALETLEARVMLAWDGEQNDWPEIWVITERFNNVNLTNRIWMVIELLEENAPAFCENFCYTVSPWTASELNEYRASRSNVR
jgi:hypothetical protein